MSKLAKLLKWAMSLIEKMLAQLGLEFLFKLIELTLISIIVIIVVLLSEVSEDLSRRIIKVSWSSVSIKSLSLISTLLLGGCKSSFSFLARRLRGK